MKNKYSPITLVNDFYLGNFVRGTFLHTTSPTVTKVLKIQEGPCDPHIFQRAWDISIGENFARTCILHPLPIKRIFFETYFYHEFS